MQIQARVLNILTKPAVEWPNIAQEPSDVAALMREYAAPLSAISAICRFLGMSIVGLSLPFGGTIRVGIVRGFVGAVVAWVLGLVGVYIAAVVVEKLAPTFQSTGNTVQALKLVVYSYTPVWIAGVLGLVPALAVLGLLAALYAVYLFYVGLPAVMRTPSDRVIPYMLVSALVMIVLGVVLGGVTSAMVGVGGLTGY